MDPKLSILFYKWQEKQEKINNSFDNSRKIYIQDIHSHELIFNNALDTHKCDVCSKKEIKEGYRCKDCDFDLCLDCYK